jgi:glycosyltransferase involved in cell wall biosynthesis
MKKNPTISLCMIVKNEEETLKRTLESVKNYVDEMIVVDTGSTDKTKEIAKSMGAVLYDFEWINDFAAARNYAKEQATSDWILQLDADEYFMNEEASLLKEEIKKTDKKALFIQITNLVEKNKMGNSHSYARLFKNVPELSYHYRIHEQILENDKPISCGTSAIRIIHTGYTDETIKK